MGRGESPAIEDYLDRLGLAPASDAVELIYHALLPGRIGRLEPDPAD